LELIHLENLIIWTNFECFVPYIFRTNGVVAKSTHHGYILMVKLIFFSEILLLISWDKIYIPS